MRKLIFFSVLAATALLTSCATCNWGIKAGPNFASVGGDDTDDLDSRFGVFFGAYTECMILDTFSVQPELIFSQQGADYTESEGFDGTFKFNYLNLPVMGKLYVNDGLFVEAGPQIGYLLSAKEEFESMSLSGEDDIKDDIKNIDFGANVGLGYQFDSGLNIGARYNFGIANINDFADSSDFSNTNNVFSFAVGFRF
ncbi:porin family protein [Muriicola soli]|uniref:PorT family protein n=1 Tax=Muriicola soli TaxID=2507538 RepID=A0A411E7Q2_9FLAO|nr:porin family protein [Muriicola soli]QBA63755.1 PorT family protein [Muriicola soli]